MPDIVDSIEIPLHIVGANLKPGKIETARNLLEARTKPRFVAKVTGLPLTKVKALIKKYMQD